MTDAAIDQSPATDTSATPTPAPAPTPPSAAPPVAEQAQDDGDLDLLSVDDADVGDDAGDAEGAETTVKALGPGEDATDEEIATWRKEHGVPDDAAGYAPTVEGVEWDQEALTPILQIAHEHNLPSKPVADALAAYAKRVQAQQAAIKQRDAENAKAVRSELTEAEIASVKSAARSMPAELRSLLNQARGPDGSRIINNPDVLRMITSTFGAKPGARTMHADVTDTRAGLQKELAEIDTAMYRDAAELSRPWKATGISAAERKAQIMQELGNRPPAANVREEEAALLALHQRDPQIFEYAKWRATEMTGAERLTRIRQGRG
jgi:hypothetical protein